MNDRLLIDLLRLAPKNLYSHWLGRVSEVPIPRPLRTRILGLYAARFGAAVEEASLPLTEYPSLHAFFTRQLAPGVRPVTDLPDGLVSPADGRVAACGQVEERQLLQVKGRRYSLHELLQEPAAEESLQRGSYATVYLAPGDYHRVHFPAGGEIVGYRYLPGTLFPVNPAGQRHVRDLYTINERLVTHVASPTQGRVSIVMVGALAVGRISVSYAPIVTNARTGHPAAQVTLSPPRPCQAGDELGVFHLGSTVVVICERPGLHPIVPEGNVVRMGQPLLVAG